MKTVSFWCKKCGGRVLEDEPYKNGNGTLMAVLTCVLCGKEHECQMRSYKHLLSEIDRVAKVKTPSR